MTREEAIEYFKLNINNLKRILDNRPKLKGSALEKEIQACEMAIKALEQETVSKESYDHEYFLRKEFELKIARLEQALDKIRAEIEPKCDRINSLASILPYTAHRKIQELLCEIMDLCKAEIEPQESEDKT